MSNEKSWCVLWSEKYGNFKASSFFRILNKFTGRAKPIPIIGNLDNQHPDKWCSTVPLNVCMGIIGYLQHTCVPRTEPWHSEYKTGVSVTQPLTSLCPCVIASVAESLHCSANTLCQHSPQRKCRHYHMAEVPLLSWWHSLKQDRSGTCHHSPPEGWHRLPASHHTLPQVQCLASPSMLRSKRGNSCGTLYTAH